MVTEVTTPLGGVLRTRGGRVGLVVVFAAGLFALKVPFWWQTGAFLTATTLWPAKRKEVLLAAAGCWIFLAPPVNTNLLTELAATRGVDGRWIAYWPIAVAATWALAALYLLCVRRISVFSRRPIAGLVAVMIALYAACSLPMPGVLSLLVIGVAMAFSQYLWFFAYWISENHTRQKNVCLYKPFFARPMWGWTNVPFGKGAVYLERVEAKSDAALLATQLSGLKLLLRAAALTAVLFVVVRYVYRSDSSVTALTYESPNPIIPPYQMALNYMAAGHEYPWHMRWISLIISFVLRVTTLAVFGHKIIAIARMAGFDAFRNTYRPFESTSVAEFYNRVYYYFKELLVTFFFFPTYLRYFKRYPRIRLMAATVAAAGVGNFLFHFMRDEHYILRIGLWRTLWMYRSYAVYALILSVAISLSQLRVKQKGKATGYRKWLAIGGVLLFYCLISIIEEPNERNNVGTYFAYFVSLFRP